MNRALDSLISRILALFDRRTNSVSTIWSRRLPVFPDVEIRDLAVGKVLNSAILIQGPIYQDPHSTFDICERYCKLYPESRVVLSTWDSQDTTIFEEMEFPNFHLVKTKKPIFAGPSNINLQIASTRAGLEFIEALGIERVLKTRSDLFLFSETFLNSCDYFFTKYSEWDHDRIIVPGFNSFLFREYSLTDQIMYSSTKNLARFWGCNFVSQVEENFISEKYLIHSYLQNIGANADVSLRRSLEVYRDYFVVVDSAEFNIIWNKGTRREVLSRYQELPFPNLSSEITHSIWLRLQGDVEPIFMAGQSLKNL
ncbi:WavE lipopolysaccharide synthesis [Candidatus Nanopelagicaceae bacterium]